MLTTSARAFLVISLQFFLLGNSILGASSQDPNLDKLQGQTWQWIRFEDPVRQFDISEPDRYTLTFTNDGSVAIRADCNRARGTYTVNKDGSFSIKVGPMTKAACPPESRSDEFVKKLSYVAHFFFREDHLFMDMMADGGTFEFQPEGVQADHCH